MSDEKKIIIFGAGNYGEYAIEYYGEDRVYCYVDNNLLITGTIYCNKKVISYQDYLKIHDGYDTVIATKAYAQIAEQLRKSGIDDFEIFSPQFKHVFNEINYYIDESNKKVALCGIDEYTEAVLKNVEKISNIQQIFIADKKSVVQFGEKWLGFQVYDLESISEDIDTVIISAGSRAAALQVYCERIIGKDILIINPFIQKKYYDTKNLIYSSYREGEDERTETDWIEANSMNPDIMALDEYVEELATSAPLFEHVEIETINRCNGICDFCPVSAGHDIREKKVMEESLFKSIVDQLADLNYSGRFATFSNNEPFLDSRIIELNRYAREKLPNARMHLFTNGTLLTLDKFIQIVQLLDELIIDNYNQQLELIPNCKVIQEYCEEHPELKEKVTIVLRKPHEILTSRGGDAPNRSHTASYPNAKCALPYKQLIIRPDGKVSLCCNDPYGKYTLGDLNQQSIMEVWNGKKYREVRKKLQIGRKEVEHCIYCDTFIIF